MLPIAGQTVGPNGLKFFVNIHGWRYRLKKFQNFFQNFFYLFPRAMPDPSASIYIHTYNLKTIYIFILYVFIFVILGFQCASRSSSILTLYI